MVDGRWGRRSVMSHQPFPINHPVGSALRQTRRGDMDLVLLVALEAVALLVAVGAGRLLALGVGGMRRLVLGRVRHGKLVTGVTGGLAVAERAVLCPRPGRRAMLLTPIGSVRG